MFVKIWQCSFYTLLILQTPLAQGNLVLDYTWHLVVVYLLPKAYPGEEYLIRSKPRGITQFLLASTYFQW